MGWFRFTSSFATRPWSLFFFFIHLRDSIYSNQFHKISSIRFFCVELMICRENCGSISPNTHWNDFQLHLFAASFFCALFFFHSIALCFFFLRLQSVFRLPLFIAVCCYSRWMGLKLVRYRHQSRFECDASSIDVHNEAIIIIIIIVCYAVLLNIKISSVLHVFGR